MSKFSDFLARKTILSFAERVPIFLTARNADERDLRHLDSTAFAEAGSRMGGENEALRGLVVETARKISDLDEVKLAFGRIIDPLHKTLQALEQEKSHNASLIGALSESRASVETLRAELRQSEKKAGSLAASQEKLRHDLEQAQQTVSGLESTRIELANENAIKATEISNLETRLGAEIADCQALSDEHRVITEQAQAAGKRLGQVESEIIAARQKITLLEDERNSLQSSLDQTLGEVSRLSRQLAETANSLSASQARVSQFEVMYAETDGERTRLVTELDETKERHRAESNSLAMRLDALQSRATTAEKLLVEARTNLASRGEEVRAFDRKVVEVTIARNAAEKKLSQIESTQQLQERQIKDLEQARSALVERNAALTNTVRARETALARAEEKIQSSAEFMARLEADIQTSRSRAEQRIEELNSMVERERMDRSIAEGTLEATRKDNARLQREIASLEASLRNGTPVDEASPAPHSKRPKNGSKSTVQPIVKA